MVKSKSSGSVSQSTRWRRFLLIVLGVVVVAAVVAALFLWFRAPRVPTDLAAGGAPATSPVTARQISDARAVELAVEVSEPMDVISNATGMVTSLDCAAGDIVSSGNSYVSVDGQPLMALATAVPLHRTLVAGDKGEDVRALQEELARLGYDVAADGQMGTFTVKTVGQLLGLEGAALANYQAVEPASFVWLPAFELVVQDCVTSPGVTINPGDALFTSAPTVLGARIVELPSGAAAGERVLVIDGEELAVAEDGSVADPNALTQLSSLASFRRFMNDEASTGIQAQYELASQTDVYAVSPASLYGIENTDGCVMDSASGDGRPVTIVSSELGQTLVIFTDGQAAPQSVNLGTSTGSSCR